MRHPVLVKNKKINYKCFKGVGDLIRKSIGCRSCYIHTIHYLILSIRVVVSVEEKKEEAKAEESDSDNEDMGFGLFD